MKSFALPLLAGIAIGTVATGVIVLARDDFYWYRDAYNANSVTTSIDASFIENMIPHHQTAIDMAELALTKAKTEEVKTLAQNIITAQGEEITTMEAWYKTWFGTDVPKNETGTHGGMMGGGMMQENMMTGKYSLTELQNASNFDKTFAEEMIPHHQMAIMMAQMLLRTTSREEMKALAQNIIDTQSAEITQMREWLAAWN